jgi:hypothetical protein
LYIEKLCILADDIIDVIKQIENPVAASAASLQPASSRPQVYLAKCSRDQKEAREALEMDLRQHGYTIFPDKQLPEEETEFVSEVSAMMEQCNFSIHLVGGSSGFVPDGSSGKSAVVLQNEIAIAQAKKSGMRRVIWVPANTEAHDQEQQHFIEALHRDAEAQFGADLITGDLEVLKAEIHSILESLERAKESPIDSSATGDLKLLYLICDQADREAVLPLRKVLKTGGFDVKIPLFEGDAATVDSAKREMLAECRAALIFYGKGGESWKRAVDSDLLKSRGYRRDKPQLRQFTYLSGPETAEKTEMIALEEPNLINGLGGFSEIAARTLLETIQVR